MVYELTARLFALITLAPIVPVATWAPVTVRAPVAEGTTGLVPGAVFASTLISSNANPPPVKLMVIVFPEPAVVMPDPPSTSKIFAIGVAGFPSVSNRVGI